MTVLLCAVVGLSLAGDSALRPFVMMRMTAAATKAPEKLRMVMSANAAHPGSADAYWFAGGTWLPDEEAHRWFADVARITSDCACAGIRVDYQQGVTLGHGEVSERARELFAGDVWQTGADGQRLKMFCPRAPEVLAYEEAWVADLCRTLRPGAIWLDDDLRLGYWKPNGCFCERCLQAFNAHFGHNFRQAELAERLFGKSEREPVRREWLAFVADSVAGFGAAARRGADRTFPECMVAYQSVNAESLLATGRDNSVLLRALSGKDARPTAIRIGSECYFEDVGELSRKMMSVARESERCRASDVRLAQICYEQENYTREIQHKSAEATLVESAVALACGCDSLSEYRWDANRDEPLSDYAEFAARLAAWRPYLERLGSFSRETSLGGVARFVGGDCDLTSAFDLSDPLDAALADLGIPVTVAESPSRLYYVTEKTLDEWAEGDLTRLLSSGGAAVVSDAAWDRLLAQGGMSARKAAADGCLVRFGFGKLFRRGQSVPTTDERRAALDAFDRIGCVPVRIDRAHRLRVMPRMRRTDGRTLAVTLWNESAGAMPSTVVRIRRPAGTCPVWASPERTDQPLYVVAATDEELTVVVPELPGRQVGTILLADRCPETACEHLAVESEKAFLPAYDASRPGWQAGYRLRAARLWEVSAGDAVLSNSVRIVAADGRVMRAGADYRLEPRYGAVGLVGSVVSNACVNPVSISYRCRMERLDAWYENVEGRIDCVRGIPAVARPKPPHLPKGARLLGHFWIRGGGRFDDGRFFRNEGTFAWPRPTIAAEEAIPKTLAKLRQGQPVAILAWGDSVTEASYLQRDERWQERVVAALRANFPRSDVRLVTEAWGGHDSRSYLAEPRGALHCFSEKVLEVRPDLVISEFVNDGGLRTADVEKIYGCVLADFRRCAIEWVVFTPHYIIPDWMGRTSVANCDEDPRAYVKALRSFAAKNGVGLADASARWGHLWREGVPYPILFVNGVNHPDETGMGFFVDAFLSFLANRSPVADGMRNGRVIRAE